MDERETNISEAPAQGRDEDIIKRCEYLISIYNQLNDLRAAHELPRFSGSTSMISRLETEIRTTKRGKNACPNVASYESHWDVLRRCGALVRILSYISRHPGSRIDCTVCPPGDGTSESCPNMSHQAKEHWVWVDAVVDNGFEWLRIVGTDEKRMLHEMVAAGWDWESDGEGSDAEPDRADGDAEEDDEFEVPLVKIAKVLTRVARSRPHMCRFPRVRILLPRITEGKDSQIDRLLQKVRQLGVYVECANSAFLSSPAPPIDAALENLLPDSPRSQPSGSVNLDTTLLVALATDMCHTKLEYQPWFSRTVTVHLKEENECGGSLNRWIYPALRGKRLICAREAAEQFWKLLHEMGSSTELQRAALIVPENPGDPEVIDRLAALQELSTYQVPADLQLPVIVAEDYFDLEREVSSGQLPTQARNALAEADVTQLNTAVFCYGWQHGHPTITSNNEARKKIVRALERSVLHHGEYVQGEGPRIIGLNCARSLVCKGPAPHRIKALVDNGVEVDRSHLAAEGP